MRGDNLANWVDAPHRRRAHRGIPVRFAAVATDLQQRDAGADRQRIGRRAIQASAAVPGVSVPVRYEGGHLVDGGITSLVPVRAARAMGADIVIAVDIYCQGPRPRAWARSRRRRVMQTQSCLVAAPEMAEADVLIAPGVSVSGMSAKDEQETAIRAGYEAARAAISAIKSKTPWLAPGAAH